MLTATIATLRQIRDDRAAKVLFFAPPAKPAVESLEVLVNLDVTPEGCYPAEYAEYERDRLLVDMQTANVIVMVYEALRPETQAKVDRLMLSKAGFIKVTNIAWGAVKAA